MWNMVLLTSLIRRDTLFLCVLIMDWAVLGGESLRLLSLDVPAAVKQGEPVWLNCTLDPEKEDLYSVKWYRNDNEFYRYLPRDSPSAQKYDIPGIFVNLRKSRQGNVYLETTDLNSEGIYRCEASAESPTFQTVEGEKYMSVYSLPKEGPIIYGNQPRYEVGDFVNLTCRSGPSKPAATLKWFINGKEAPSVFTSLATVSENPYGLQTSSLGLMFPLSPEHLRQAGDSINLRCTAIVSQTYSMSSEELVVGDKRPETSSAAGTKLPLIKQYYTRDGPTISGGQPHYKPGDYLNINCSSSKLNRAPELQWFRNDREVNSRDVVRYSLTKHPDGQETAVVGLRFVVQPQHFEENEEMRLKCTATLSEVINMRSEERTVGGNHRSSGLHVSEDHGKVTARNSATKLGEHLFLSLMMMLAVRICLR